MIDTKQKAKDILEEYANSYSQVDLEQLAKHLDSIRDEAIKEFADRLKEHLKGNGGLFCVTTMNAKIDNLVKEMVRADDEKK